MEIIQAKAYSDKFIRRAARLAHEVNRAYCQAIGDDSQPKWEDAPEWQKDSAIAGVRFVLYLPDVGPNTVHEAWLKSKAAANSR